jgi:glycerol-3-phosphate acyltransferase PlsY
VATIGGILFAMNWAGALIACAVWVVVFVPFRYVSLGSVIAALSLPIAQHFTWGTVKGQWKNETPWVMTIFLGVAGLLVIWRHKANLQRLFEGTEKRFGTKQA